MGVGKNSERALAKLAHLGTARAHRNHLSNCCTSDFLQQDLDEGNPTIQPWPRKSTLPATARRRQSLEQCELRCGAVRCGILAIIYSRANTSKDAHWHAVGDIGANTRWNDRKSEETAIICWSKITLHNRTALQLSHHFETANSSSRNTLHSTHADHVSDAPTARPTRSHVVPSRPLVCAYSP